MADNNTSSLKPANAKKRNEERHERKSREPRVIDDSPAEVDSDGNLVRIQKPDKQTNDASIRSIMDRIDELKQERSEINKKLIEYTANNRPFVERRSELNAALNIERSERQKLLDEADSIKTRVNAIAKKNDTRRSKEKKVKAQLRFDNIEQVDSKLKSLELRHETTCLSKPEEKVLMREIAELRSTRRKVGEFLKEQKVAREADNTEDLRMLSALMSKCYEQAKVHQSAEAAQRQEIADLNEKNKSTSETTKKLYERRKEIEKSTDALFQEHDALRAQHYKELLKFRKYSAAVAKQREEERKKRDLVLEMERKEIERKLDEEEMAKKPWESEIAFCDILIVHLQKLLGKKKTIIDDNAEISPSPSVVTSTEKVNVENSFSGLQMLNKKSLDNYMVMGSGIKKKKKAPNKKDKKIVHSIELMQSFSLIDLVPPVKMEDIPDAIDALQKKRAHYDVLPRAPRKKDASAEPSDTAASTSAPKKEKSSKKDSIPSVDSSDLFPVLPGFKLPKAKPQDPFSELSAVDCVKTLSRVNEL